MRIELEDIAHIAGEIGLDPDKKKELLAKAEEVIAAEKAEASALAKEREKEGKPHVILISTGDPKDCVGNTPLFVLKSAAKHNHHEALVQFIEAVKEHNSVVMEKKGGRKKKITTVGEAFEFLPGKFLKSRGLKILFKEPLIVVNRPNEIDDSESKEAS